MSLRDTAGRLLSRLRGTAARNRYASAVQQKIDAVRAAQGQAQAKAESRLDRGLAGIRRERQTGEAFSDLRRELRQQQAKQFEQARADIGIGAIGSAPDFSGIDPEDLTTEWIPVQSSNVGAIRWVGGDYGLQVRFKKKGWEYAYRVPYSTFQDMLEASSKGSFVWYALRIPGVPYTRLTAGIAPSRLAYNFGRTVGGKNNRELLRNKNFAFRSQRKAR